jgi:hypothetical protein
MHNTMRSDFSRMGRRDALVWKGTIWKRWLLAADVRFRHSFGLAERANSKQ